MSLKIRKLTYSALFAAVILLATAAFPIPLPFGYVNMGDAFVLLSASVLGPVYGAVSAGVGAALADLFLGFGVYAPATFVIKALMAITVYGVARLMRGVTSRKTVQKILGAVCAELVMVLGYFAYESFLYGVQGAFAGIVGNTLQACFAVVAFCVIVHLFGDASKKLFSTDS